MVLVAALVASLAAFSQREKVTHIIAEGAIKDVDAELAEYTGGPQTILLIGADQRKEDKKLGVKARSDTMMLVRLDPNKKVTTVLSIPRDLRVSIPGRGLAKFNESYSHGGAKLVIRTIKENFGLKVNHVAEVDFHGFAKAVDAIDCVYVDVDRHYYHSNDGVPMGAQFAAIDIKAGYQKLCGYRALDYVRFRHYDSDIYREARQQGFLRQSKQQVGVTKLFTNANSLMKIVAKNVHTDRSLAKGKNLQRMLTLAARSSGKPVYQVEIPNLTTPMIGGVSYVVATSENMKKAAANFKQGPKQKGQVSEVSGDTSTTQSTTKKKKKARKGVSSALTPAIDAGLGQAAIVGRKVKIPVFYPTGMVNGASYQNQSTRGYRITLKKGKRASAYRIVAKLSNSAGDYYGIQGVKWIDPPILKNPSEKRNIGGREYSLYYEGSKLALVSFQRAGASYWVSNTLTRKLTTKQMMGLAESLRLKK